MTEQRQPTPTELLAQIAQAALDQDFKLEELQMQNEAIIERLEQLRRVNVKVIDLNIPFWNLTGLLIKIALAAIPAAIALSVLFWLFMMLITSAGGW